MITIKLLAAFSLTFLDQWTATKFRLTMNEPWYCNYTDAFILLEKAQSHCRESDLDSTVLINLGRNRPEFEPRPHTIENSTIVDHTLAYLVDDAHRRVIDMNQFDGRPENHLSSTTMHLSFTKWERSLDMAISQGKQDVQFPRKESVISIRESGRWIGDVDVMAALKSPHIYTSPPQKPCDCNHQNDKEDKPSLDPSLRSI